MLRVAPSFVTKVQGVSGGSGFTALIPAAYVAFTAGSIFSLPRPGRTGRSRQRGVAGADADLPVRDARGEQGLVAAAGGALHQVRVDLVDGVQQPDVCGYVSGRMPTIGSAQNPRERLYGYLTDDTTGAREARALSGHAAAQNILSLTLVALSLAGALWLTMTDWEV
jgi:hypothetical protein